MAISMLKIRRPLGRLIFNMGIAIPGKTVFLIETAPRRVKKVLWVRFYPNHLYFTNDLLKKYSFATKNLRYFDISIIDNLQGSICLKLIKTFMNAGSQHSLTHHWLERWQNRLLMLKFSFFQLCNISMGCYV